MVLSIRFRQERSIRGCRLSVLKSGLQKGIRRGNLDLALTCILELWSFGQAIDGRLTDRKRVRTNILHRLQIIFLEDAGQEQHWAQAEQLLDRCRHGTWPAKSALVTLGAFLCRLPKSRGCSHARAVAAFCESSWVKDQFRNVYTWAQACPKEPTFAQLATLIRRQDWLAIIGAHRYVDQKKQFKTPYGRKSYWAPFHALNQSLSGIDRRENAAYMKSLVVLGARWGKELQSTREAFLCWMVPLLASLRSSNAPVDVPAIELSVPPDLVSRLESGPVDFPDYVRDMHVTGIADPARFALEGSVVTNEDVVRVNPVWKKLYIASKLSGPVAAPTGKRAKVVDDSSYTFTPADMNLALPMLPDPSGTGNESEFATFVMRTQLTTSKNKTDVYLVSSNATSRDPSRLVIVKGPFKNVADVTQAYLLSEWKRANGLPAPWTRLVWLRPDRWAAGVPLGVRNTLDRTQPAPFLVCECLIPFKHVDGAWQIPAKTHSSKLWPSTTVPDWDQVSASLPQAAGHWAPMKRASTAREQTQYVLALLYRYIFGIGDMADRNFMCCGGRVYSIDEDGRLGPVSFQSDLRAKKAARAKEWCRTHWEVLEPQLRAWKLPTDDHRLRRRTLLAAQWTIFDH